MSHLLQEKLLLYQIRIKKDPEAFAKIYDLYARRIYRFVYFKVSSEEEAQDITADAFLKAWQYLLDEKGREVKHLNALLYSIARNRVIDHYRSRAARETVPLIEEAEELISDDRLEQEKAEARIDTQFLEKHLRLLKDEYREVLVMKFLDEMDNAEISRILDGLSVVFLAAAAVLMLLAVRRFLPPARRGPSMYKKILTGEAHEKGK